MIPMTIDQGTTCKPRNRICYHKRACLYNLLIATDHAKSKPPSTLTPRKHLQECENVAIIWEKTIVVEIDRAT